MESGSFDDVVRVGPNFNNSQPNENVMNSFKLTT